MNTHPRIQTQLTRQFTPAALWTTLLLLAVTPTIVRAQGIAPSPFARISASGEASMEPAAINVSYSLTFQLDPDGDGIDPPGEQVILLVGYQPPDPCQGVALQISIPPRCFTPRPGFFSVEDPLGCVIATFNPTGLCGPQVPDLTPDPSLPPTDITLTALEIRLHMVDATTWQLNISFAQPPDPAKTSLAHAPRCFRLSFGNDAGEVAIGKVAFSGQAP